MVSNEILGLLMDVSELMDRLNVLVVREMKRRGYRGKTEADLMCAVRAYRGRACSEDTKADVVDDLGEYMVYSLSEEAGDASSFEDVLMSYEILRNLNVTDRMYVMSGRDVAKDRVYVNYMLDVFKGKLSIEQGATLGLMLENYVKRVREDAKALA